MVMTTMVVMWTLQPKKVKAPLIFPLGLTQWPWLWYVS